MKNFLFKKCELKTNEKFGRYVVAAENIKEGELILAEFPTVVGPYWDSQISCVNCYKPSDTMCRKCKIVPLCWHCLEHHDSNECKAISEMNLPKTFLLDHFDVLTPLRVLLLILQQFKNVDQQDGISDLNDDPIATVFDEILSMESHCTVRRDTLIWYSHAKNVVKPLREMGIIDAMHKIKKNPHNIDDEFVQKICGILDVNTFEVRTPNFEEFPVRGLYTQAALLAHDCIGNTFITVDNARQLKIFASVDIPSGEIIYNNYTATLYGTEARQEHLIKGKYFRCECMRCIDPTELGTHLSSLKCQACQIGCLIQMYGQSKWTCLNCNAFQPNEKIDDILREIRHHVNNLGSQMDKIELSIAKYSCILHPNHYLLIEMKQKLAAIIRHMGEMNSDYCKSEKLLSRKIELCKEIVPLLDILQPGISRLKGIALYEQFLPLMQLSKIYYQEKSISLDEYYNYLIEAEALAKESIRMLIYEPISNPEGMLAKQAMFELKDLRVEKNRIENQLKGVEQRNMLNRN